MFAFEDIYIYIYIHSISVLMYWCGCRESLLAGLKANWEDLHHQYQGLSVVTDTAPKKARKERMEAEMKQLEKDIDLIERHRRLYVSQPQPSHW